MRANVRFRKGFVGAGESYVRSEERGQSGVSKDGRETEADDTALSTPQSLRKI